MTMLCVYLKAFQTSVVGEAVFWGGAVVSEIMHLIFPTFIMFPRSEKGAFRHITLVATENIHCC